MKSARQYAAESEDAMLQAETMVHTVERDHLLHRATILAQLSTTAALLEQIEADDFRRATTRR